MADDEDIPTEEEFSFKLSYDEDEELIESLNKLKIMESWILISRIC